MKETQDKDNLDRVAEMILDEHKLVTYVSLSRDLCIHVNKSKSLLDEIVKDIRSKGNNVDLNVNYIISGLLVGNKAETTVCNETDIGSMRSKFKTIFFEHLYSVSVGAPSADNVSLLAVNKFEDFYLCTGQIISKSCIKRSADEIEILKTGSNNATHEKKQLVVSSNKIKEENLNGSLKPNGITIKDKAPTVLIKTEKFNENDRPVADTNKIQQTVKVEITSPMKKSSSDSVVKNGLKSSNKGQKGIAGFFSKPSNSSSSKSSLTENKEKTSSKIGNNTPNIFPKTEKMEIDDTDNNTKSEETKDEVTSKTNNANKSHEKINVSSKPNTLNKSLEKIKKTSKVDKKRKRVLHVSDSESDDEKNDPFVDETPEICLESDDEIPPTPSVNTVKITSGIINPKKRRKIVDKTYTDEDGYILTKKEEVYESCSENEDESSVKENQNQHPKGNLIKTEISPKEKKPVIKNKKKAISPKKGKQATLMNFFKKM